MEKALLTKLGITDDITEEVVIELNNSDDYAKMYSILDQSEDADLAEVRSITTEDMNVLVYETDHYDIELLANFEKDIYRVAIKLAEEVTKDE